MRKTPHPWGRSPWTVRFRPQQKRLPDSVDFLVVGAGFAGLAAAATLLRRNPDKSVLVLEAFSLGEGASGRTGGMALAETAAGPLPGLGDVLKGYKKILKELKVDSEIALPGAFELAREKTKKGSPILWNDSGWLGVVKKVPGGTINPGKVLAGLARAAESSGAQIVEHAEVLSIDFTTPLQIHLRAKSRKATQEKTITAQKILLATNAASLELTGLRKTTDPMLTLAIATAPLAAKQRRALGLGSRQPFYTVDFPYLWGRLMKNNSAIFGAGIVGVEGTGGHRAAKQVKAALAEVPPTAPTAQRQKFHQNDTNPLAAVNIYKKGPASDRLEALEHRVRHLHPGLRKIKITHRWGGPILFTEKMIPIFRHHPRNKNILILAGFSGHGVALSVYLGDWAAESLLERRALPDWSA